MLLATVYPSELGGDFRMYLAIAHRVLSGGPLYEPRQLAGPYVTVPGDSMYPPIAFPLFAAFTVLPAALWWAPVAIVGYRLRSVRGWRLAAILWLLAVPSTLPIIWTGNPVMWAMVGLALPRWWSWTVLLKPSVFPFALIGIRDRRWWVAAGCLGLASLAVLPLTLQWFAVILNARGVWAGPLYSLGNAPLLLIPIVTEVDVGSVRDRIAAIPAPRVAAPLI